ncbi:MAG: peptidoglycan DD-metalloendopeptidase family protein [bacterium]
MLLKRLIKKYIKRFLTLKKIKRKVASIDSKKAVMAVGFLGVVILVYVFLGYLLKSEVKEEQPLEIIYEGEIKRGDTIYDLLKNYQIDEKAFLVIKKELKNIDYNPSRIKPGDSFTIACSTTGCLLSFKVNYNPAFEPFNYAEVKLSTSGVYEAFKGKIETIKRIQGVEGKINSSLWNSMVKNQGLSHDIFQAFVLAFQWDIDFNTEQRVGDSYRVIWEREIGKNGVMKEGTILAAEYSGKETGKVLGIYFKTKDGKGGYYDINGKSKRRNFLKAPLNYARISSYFTNRRFHPILKYYRPHRGIDYAAPRGTPVQSVADGKVIHAGWKGESGKAVIIKHNSVYTTAYGHLSIIKNGIKVGVHVNQGQEIGYVGSTGLATGPHLDFRIKVNEKLMNYLTLKFPPAESVKEEGMEEFKEQKRRILRYISELDQSRNENDIISLEDISSGQLEITAN